MSSLPPTLEWVGGTDGTCRLVEQTLLPGRLEFLDVDSVEAMVDAIVRLAVRGAPAIGCAGAYGVVIGMRGADDVGVDDARERLDRVAAVLDAARPTAVNLGWAVRRMAECGHAFLEGGSARGLPEALLAEACLIHDEDAEMCRRMGAFGAALLESGDTCLTVCNAGALATGGQGTALSVFYEADRSGKTISVVAPETRPLLQGARLTSWELMQSGIDVTLITDNMVATVMARSEVAACVVGSDRIAANGDVANKVGTYAMALLAHAHGIPFYVVAPTTTIDPDTATGPEIPIEERDPAEVTAGFGPCTAPEGVQVFSPAFDVTPAEFVTAIITEKGVVESPDADKIAAHLAGAPADPPSQPA